MTCFAEIENIISIATFRCGFHFSLLICAPVKSPVRLYSWLFSSCSKDRHTKEFGFVLREYVFSQFNQTLIRLIRDFPCYFNRTDKDSSICLTIQNSP